MTTPYPHDTSWTVERDGVELDVLAEYAVDERGTPASGLSGPPENYDPGSGWVFCINPLAMLEGGATVTLTEAEMDKIHAWLEENHEDDDGCWEDY